VTVRYLSGTTPLRGGFMAGGGFHWLRPTPDEPNRLAHQWFGDLVTCRDWGHAWLNEGFASFFEALYMEHSRGRDAYDHEIEGAMQSYFAEARRYKRPVATHLYPKPNDMFDSHTYPKGEVILHTLRRTLGDRAFFAGLRHYLNKNRHHPVDTHDLCEAMSESTGVNLEPFFDQWIFKPGHPVLDYRWTWDEGKNQVVLTVKQTQGTADGTPIYRLNAAVGLIRSGSVSREKVTLDKAEQEIRLDAREKPDAVLLDPDHDFLREIPAQHWESAELLPILRWAPNPEDRAAAMRQLLAGMPDAGVVRAVVEALRADRGPFPAFRSAGRLGELARPELRAFFREELRHPDFGRRAEAVRALGRLPADETDSQALRLLVNDQQPYAAVRAALSVLARWNAPANRSLFTRAAGMTSPDGIIRLTALDALAQADAAEGKPHQDPHPMVTDALRALIAQVVAGEPEPALAAPGLRGFALRRFQFTAGALKEIKSFSFLAEQNVAARPLQRRGTPVDRIVTYKAATEPTAFYVTFYLTPEGKVADLEIVPE
jgi:aminopeptidase N